jgi:hypothetical protein
VQPPESAARENNQALHGARFFTFSFSLASQRLQRDAGSGGTQNRVDSFERQESQTRQAADRGNFAFGIIRKSLTTWIPWATT